MTFLISGGCIVVIWSLILNINWSSAFINLLPFDSSRYRSSSTTYQGKSPSYAKVFVSLPKNSERPIASKPIVPRKEHVNKYAKFSSKKQDPLEVAKAQQDKMKALGNDLSAPVRGTTVPLFERHLDKPEEKENRTIQFPSHKEIVPSDPYTFGYVHVGKILIPHGVKGEVKVKFETDFAESRVKANSTLYIKRPNRRTPRPIKVQSGKRQIDNLYIVKFADIRSRLSALAFKDYSVYVRLEDRPPLEVDEYLVRDLIDLPCYLNVTLSAKGKKTYLNKVGVVAGVVLPDDLCDVSAASLIHAMLEIKKPGLQEELCLIPFVPSIVLDVDRENSAILLDPPSGLLDITYVEQKRIVIKGYLPERAIGLTEENRVELSLSKQIIFV
jgi:16S rRNA processing protein RimM